MQCGIQSARKTTIFTLQKNWKILLPFRLSSKPSTHLPLLSLMRLQTRVTVPLRGYFSKTPPPEAFVVVSFCCRALSPLSKLLFLTETTNALPCQRLGPELDLSKFSKLNYHFLNYNDSFSNFKGWILLPPSEISRVTIGSDFPQFRCPSLQKCGCSSLIITT